MKILFIGIFDANEPNTGFRNAFRKVADEYQDVAWNMAPNNDQLNRDLIEVITQMSPTLIFMQLQSKNVINNQCLSVMKESGSYLVQWTGDARQPLPRHYIDFGRKINLSLFNNQDDVETMLAQGVKADFLQIAFDHNIYKPSGPITDSADIVFMGNNYNNVFALSRYRYDMVQFLRNAYGHRFALYGTNWPKKWGVESLMYRQEQEAQIYRSCKIGINLSHYDLRKYASDRLFRIMGCGAMCISKVFPDMVEYEDGQNFVTFDGGFRDLQKKIDYYLQYDDERRTIAETGCMRTHGSWTWDHRIQELFTLIEKHKNELGKDAA